MPIRNRRSPSSTDTSSGDTSGRLSSSGSRTQRSAGREVLPASVEFVSPESDTPMLDALEQEAPEQTHEVRRGENLTVIARTYGVEVKDLIEHNGLRDPNSLSVGQTLRIPDARTIVADEAPGEDVYFVRRGDTLARIARRFGVDIDQLADVNGITDRNFIHIGQPLRIPGMDPGPAPSTSPGRRPDADAQAAEEPQQEQGGQEQVYTVQSGDVLARIARRFEVSVSELARANGIANPNRISVGQRLVIPGTSSAVEGGAMRPGETSVSQEVAEATDLEQGEVDTAQIQDAPAMQQVVERVLRVAPRHEYARTAIPGILRQAAASGVRNANQVAYILATADHETDFGKPTFRRSETLVEDSNAFRQGSNGQWSASNHVSGGRSTGTSRSDLERRYWDDAYGGRLGNRRGTMDAANYRGRGFVQLTGRVNYEKMTNELNREGFQYELDGVVWGRDQPIDLLANPTHVNRNQELASRALVEGMMEGLFTGRELGQYVNDDRADFYNARAVVNGDKRTNGRSIERTARQYAGALSSWGNVFRGQS
jgi:LysM repeat protein/predicted chitinase